MFILGGVIKYSGTLRCKHVAKPSQYGHNLVSEPSTTCTAVQPNTWDFSFAIL